MAKPPEKCVYCRKVDTPPKRWIKRRKGGYTVRKVGTPLPERWGRPPERWIIRRKGGYTVRKMGTPLPERWVDCQKVGYNARKVGKPPEIYR